MSGILMQKDERRKRANEVRLNAIQQKIKKNENEQSQIKKALEGLDSDSKKSTHICFSDSDDSDCTLTKPETGKSNADQLLGFLGEDSTDEEIVIKPQFQGKDGSKLLELQSSYGNDARFKLDERFATEESDDSVKVDEKAEEDPRKTSDNANNERSRNMKLLNEVLGHDVISHDHPKRKSDKFVDVSSLRYDPIKGAHLEIKPSKNESLPTKKKKKKEKREEVTEVDKSRFFKTSSDVLKDAFAEKSEKKDSNQSEEKPFSILAMLGREDDAENDKSLMMKDGIEEGFKFSFPTSKEESIPTLEKKFKYDSSDTDEDEINDEDMEKSEKTKSSISVVSQEKRPGYPKTFFMTSPSDPRIVDGVKAFCWNKSFEQVRDEWLEVKDTLIKDYKKKHRDAKRKERKAKYEAKQLSMTNSV